MGQIRAMDFYYVEAFYGSSEVLAKSIQYVLK